MMATSPRQMIAHLRDYYGLNSPKVFSALLAVPREEFVPKGRKQDAYRDGPINIGHGQTISQPYTVAFMTSLLQLKGDEKVLEIGTGSGYQAAVLSKLARKVYTVEIIKSLALKAKKTLANLGYNNIKVKVGDGARGWPEHSPYDRILITAGVEGGVPDEFFDQLADNGILVAPVGDGADKQMTRFTKKKRGIKKEEFGIFHFVPFVDN